MNWYIHVALYAMYNISPNPSYCEHKYPNIIWLVEWWNNVFHLNIFEIKTTYYTGLLMPNNPCFSLILQHYKFGSVLLRIIYIYPCILNPLLRLIIYPTKLALFSMFWMLSGLLKSGWNRLHLHDLFSSIYCNNYFPNYMYMQCLLWIVVLIKYISPRYRF